MDYRIYWNGRGGIGVVSKVYSGCADQYEAVEKYRADQGTQADLNFVAVMERDDTDYLLPRPELPRRKGWGTQGFDANADQREIVPAQEGQEQQVKRHRGS